MKTQMYFVLLLLFGSMSSFAQMSEEDFIGGSWIAQENAVEMNGMPFVGLVLETDTAGFYEEVKNGQPNYYTRADWRLDNDEIKLTVVSSEGVWSTGDVFRLEYVYSEKDDWLIILKGNDEFVYERFNPNP